MRVIPHRNDSNTTGDFCEFEYTNILSHQAMPVNKNIKEATHE